MTILEERLNEISPNHCRACLHFTRVNFDSIRNVINRQGFCILGELKGDYGLYVSCSKSVECMGFIFDERNYQISKIERGLDSEENEYLHTLNDKRCKNYKDLLPLVEAHKDFFQKLENQPKGVASMFADQKIRSLGVEHFYAMNKERFVDLYNMVTLRKADYSKFLAQISVELHDRFCQCNHISFNEEGQKKEREELEIDPGSPKALFYESIGLPVANNHMKDSEGGN